MIRKIKNKPQISIIVPIYNIQQWLDRCIKSVLNQDFKDFELILVNDGSTDDSAQVCKKYITKDSRIIFLNKKNGGLSDARNYGLKYANGKYIVFIDGDDYVSSDYLSVLIKSIEYSQAEVAICEYNLVSEDGKIIKSQILNEPDDFSIINGKTLIKYSYKNGGVVNIVAWNKIYRRELFDNVKFAKGRFYEDEYLLVPMFWKINKISLVRKSLYNYVQRSNSIMSTPLTIEKIMDSDNLKLERIKFFSKKDNDLYALSIQDLKNWLININRERAVQNSNKLNCQKQYRQLVREKKGKDLKSKVKDLIGYINLNLLYDLHNLNNKIHKG